MSLGPGHYRGLREGWIKGHVTDDVGVQPLLPRELATEGVLQSNSIGYRDCHQFVARAHPNARFLVSLEGRGSENMACDFIPSFEFQTEVGTARLLAQRQEPGFVMVQPGLYYCVGGGHGWADGLPCARVPELERTVLVLGQQPVRVGNIQNCHWSLGPRRAREGFRRQIPHAHSPVAAGGEYTPIVSAEAHAIDFATLLELDASRFLSIQVPQISCSIEATDNQT